MPIGNDNELAAAVEQAGTLLQEIQNYLGDRNTTAARVRFPRGFIRTAQHHWLSLPIMHDNNVRRNIGYALMMLDVFRWQITRTDLSATALEMVIKEIVCLMASICETLTTRRGVFGLGRNQSFTSRTTRLVALNLIDDELKGELDWLWNIRRREHFWDHTELEWGVYTRTDCNRAHQAMTGLIVALRNHYG